MVKLNKKELTAAGKLLLNDDFSLNNEIDWKQFLVDYQNQSPAEAVGNIMNKLMSKEGLEFDQICLILKHYLMQSSEKDDSHLSVFVHESSSTTSHVNLLVERFNQSRGVNEQWMISEIFKLVTSVCTPQQAGMLVRSSSFQTYLLTSAFNVNILQQLKSGAGAGGIKMSEQAILANIFDTISNICEIKSELVNAVTTCHIEWVASALCESDHTNKDLILSLARFLHVLTEHLVKSDESSVVGGGAALESIMLEFYLTRSFFLNCYSHLATFQAQNDEQALVYLNAKLLLIESFVNLIVSSEKFESELKLNKSVYLLNILREYSTLTSQALNLDLEEAKKSTASASDDDSTSDNEKVYFRTFEKAIESKLLSIDIISSICEYFSPDGEGDEEELESVESGDEEMTDIEMGQQQQQSNISNHAVDSQQVDELRSLLHQSGTLSLLLKTICKDNAQSFQQTEKIAHICNSIKLIRVEAIKTYLLVVDSFYSTSTVGAGGSLLDIEHLFSLMNVLISRPIEEFLNEDDDEQLLNKLVDLIHALFIYFNEKTVFDLEKRAMLVDVAKQALFKFKTDSIDLCIKLARMIGLVAIRTRNENNPSLGMPLISQCAAFLIEMTTASFQLPDQQKLETLRLNAELMDLLIDLFSEDNMSELEASLGFVDKIKSISDMFYAKFKQLGGKKQKMAKEKNAVLRTVKDNFKDFVEYKIKNSPPRR